MQVPLSELVDYYFSMLSYWYLLIQDLRIIVVLILDYEIIEKKTEA